eukprot:6256512-Prymnesium_polylepis.2
MPQVTPQRLITAHHPPSRVSRVSKPRRRAEPRTGRKRGILPPNRRLARASRGDRRRPNDALTPVGRLPSMPRHAYPTPSARARQESHPRPASIRPARTCTCTCPTCTFFTDRPAGPHTCRASPTHPAKPTRVPTTPGQASGVCRNIVPTRRVGG